MRYLLLSRNDWNATGGVAPAPVQPYPVDATEQFVNDLLRSNQWRGNPEYLLQRTVRLIKEIDRVGPLATTVPMELQVGQPEPVQAMPVIDLALTCEDCGFQAKTKAALGSHKRKHTVTA